MAQIFFNVSISFNIYTFLISPPAFSIAFTAVLDNNYSYDMIYPTPYWLPFKFSCVLNERNVISQYENKHRT